MDPILKIGSVGIPFIGGLVIWWRGEQFPRRVRWVAVTLLGLTGFFALTLNLLNGYYACIFAFREQNCAFEGLGSLSLFLLSLILVRGSLYLGGEELEKGFAIRVLFVSAWAGMWVGLVDNLFVFLVFFNVFLFVSDRWLRRRGLRWRFLTLRDDYKND